MRTLRNTPGFMVNLPTSFSQMLDSDFNRNNSNKPAANIYETEAEFAIELSAPGFNKSDFNIKIENKTLMITAEIAEKENIETKKFTLREFSSLSVNRKFMLPEDKIDEEAITANYENGILKLILPKREEAKMKAPKLVNVQ